MTHLRPPKAGDFVKYHGSQDQYHGDIYRIASVPDEWSGRGYTLTRVNAVSLLQKEAILSNVHRDSFTVIASDTTMSDDA